MGLMMMTTMTLQELASSKLVGCTSVKRSNFLVLAHVSVLHACYDLAKVCEFLEDFTCRSIWSPSSCHPPAVAAPFQWVIFVN